jgi:hypothetical protein
MTVKNHLVGAAACIVKASMCAVLALCLLQCGAEQAPGDGHEEVASVQQALANCGSVACTGINDCTSVANWPLCAKPLSAVCHSVSHECTWQLKNDPACPCLERDVRLCNVDAGVPGVQICTANAARTYTYWGACTACAACQ